MLRIAPAQGEPALLSCAVVLFPLLCVVDACLRPLTPILGAPPVRRKPTVPHYLRVVSLFAVGVLSEAHWICWAGAAQGHGAACATNALAAVVVILLVRLFFDSTGVLGAPRSRAASTKLISLGRFLVNVLVVAMSTELANFGWVCGRALSIA